MSRQLFAFRIALVFIVFLAIFGALGHFYYVLQIERHGELHAKAKDLYTTSVVHTGIRGGIYDRNGNLLVGNVSCRDIAIEPRRMSRDQCDYITECLSEMLDLDRDDLTTRLASGRVEFVVKNCVDTETAMDLAELKIPGLRFIDRQRRTYPKNQMLANILGFTDDANSGVYGLEAIWDEQLAPRQGHVVFERGRKGTKLGPLDPVNFDALDGNSIYLTIEEPLQHIVERELLKMVANSKPRRAYAVMANPRTGAVMAMAQWPTFNPNDRSRMDSEQWRNHLASDVYEPGSTMKCVAVAGAIDFGVVTLDSIFDCEDGSWFYAGKPLRDSGHRYGRLRVSEIIQKSSNIGTAKIALALGQQRLYQTLRRFGFGQTTGLRLPNESPGLLRSVRHWDGLSITRYPIGQGVSVTPLQMVQAYCALANDGYMMQLYLVDRIVASGNGQDKEFPPRGKHYVLRRHAVEDIVSAMTLVTQEGGTATRAAVPGYVVAGKTGTSQKLVDGSYEGHGQYVASFVGFVPARDPAFVLLVVADAPSAGSYYGGSVAAPVFSRISEQALRYLSVPPDRPEEMELVNTRVF